MLADTLDPVQLAEVVDDLCVIKSCWAESPNHATALLQMNTGHTRSGYPSAGSWLTYGLGSENADLPGFVVLQSGSRGPRGGSANWGSGFLPSRYQGVRFRNVGDLYLSQTR